MHGKDPFQITFVQLLALLGTAFCKEGWAKNDRGETKTIVYFPEYKPPMRNQDQQPMVPTDFDMYDVVKTILFKGNVKGVTGMVVFECPVMDSSCLGNRQGMVYGPSCTFKTLNEAWWENEEKKEVRVRGTRDPKTGKEYILPSNMQLPICYYEKDPADDPSSQSTATIKTAPDLA